MADQFSPPQEEEDLPVSAWNKPADRYADKFMHLEIYDRKSLTCSFIIRLNRSMNSGFPMPEARMKLSCIRQWSCKRDNRLTAMDSRIKKYRFTSPLSLWKFTHSKNYPGLHFKAGAGAVPELRHVIELMSESQWPSSIDIALVDPVSIGEKWITQIGEYTAFHRLLLRYDPAAAMIETIVANTSAQLTIGVSSKDELVHMIENGFDRSMKVGEEFITFW